MSEVTKFQFTLSDESKERIIKLLDFSKTIAHFGFIPFVLYLGWSSSSNKPSIFNLLSPFPSA
ncbi:Mitochondrial import receptor subunit TOM7 [Spathaspora sp. JA1]|nr:Mitochondrial import receptor subunit TOM7 [Spathaspora sp. JA1]